MVLDRSPTPFCMCRFFSHLCGTEDSVIRPVSRVHRLPPNTRPRTPLRRVTERLDGSPLRRLILDPTKDYQPMP